MLWKGAGLAEPRAHAHKSKTGAAFVVVLQPFRFYAMAEKGLIHTSKWCNCYIQWYKYEVGSRLERTPRNLEDLE